MAEARVAVVEQLFRDLPEPADDQERRRREGERKIFARYYPAAIKLDRPRILEEGRQSVLKQLGVQRIEEASQLIDVKRQHNEQIAMLEKSIGRAAHRDGMLWGVLLGGGLIATVIAGTWLIVTQVVMLNTATQRVNYPRPSLTYEAPVTQYEHARREPGDAP